MCKSFYDLAEIDSIACAIARSILSLELSPDETDHLVALISARTSANQVKANGYYYNLCYLFPSLEKDQKKSANSDPHNDTNLAQNLALEPKKGSLAPLKKQKKRKNP